VFHDLLNRAAAIPLRIFEKFAKLAEIPSQIVGISGSGKRQSGAPGGRCGPARLRPCWHALHL